MTWFYVLFIILYQPFPWRTSVAWKGEMGCMGNCQSPIKILSQPTHWGGHCKKNTSWIKTPQAQIPGLSRDWWIPHRVLFTLNNLRNRILLDCKIMSNKRAYCMECTYTVISAEAPIHTQIISSVLNTEQ